MKSYRYSSKKLIALFIIMVLIFAVPATVSAEAKSDVLFTLGETRNMAITVTYSTEVPVIRFIAPNGEEFYDGMPGNKLSVQYTEGTIFYLIPGAMPGDWTIEYDKLSNPSLEVSYAPYAEAVVIEDFKIDSINYDTAYVSFDVSYADNSSFEYIISAVVTDNDLTVSGQKELTRGSGITNRTTTVGVPLSSLTSYGSYRFKLEVYLYSGGLESFDTYVTEESFSYENPRSPDGIRDFYAEVNLTEGSLLLDWSEEYVYGCQEYIVAVYSSADPGEPVFYSAFEPDIKSTGILIDTSVDYIRAEVYYRRNGVLSKPAVKEIKVNTGTSISIATPEVTNAAQAVIDYESVVSIPAIVTVNENSQVINISGKGYFSVNLKEFTNEIKISYSPSENVNFIIEAEIYSDRTPPLLQLYENTSTVSTPNPTFTLAGETEPGCTVQINGQGITVNEDGTFLHELTLSAGDNIFTVISSDVAGNSAMQTINIRRSSSAAAGRGGFSVKDLLPLIITFGLSMVLVICVLLFSKTYAKRAPESRFFAILTVIRNSFAVITPIAFGAAITLFFLRRSAREVIESAGYFDLVQESLQKAYEAIGRYEMLNRSFIIACIVFGGSLLITILLSLLIKLIKRRSNDDTAAGN